MSADTSFRRRLAQLRRRAKLSQEALAERAGLSRNYIGLLETGRRQPSWNTARKIAGALGVDLNTLDSVESPMQALEMQPPYAEEFDRVGRRLSKYRQKEASEMVKTFKQIMRLHPPSSED